MSWASILKGLTEVGRTFGYAMHGFLRKGFSRDDAFARIGDRSPIAVRSQSFGRDWNIIARAEDGWSRMKFVRRNAKIRSGYVETKLPLSGKYRTLVGFDVSNPVTGESFRMYRDVVHNSILTRGELEDLAKQSIERDTRGSDVEIGNGRPEVALFTNRVIR